MDGLFSDESDVSRGAEPDMITKPEEGIIAARLLKSLNGANRVALGPGIPERIRQHLPGSVETHSLNGNAGSGGGAFDVVVVEAVEVNPAGDVSLPPEIRVDNLSANRWIVATLHLNTEGGAKLVRENRHPVSRHHCVNEIITELAVIQVEPFGFALREVAPGVSSDDVRHRVDASLHVADDLKVMEW